MPTKSSGKRVRGRQRLGIMVVAIAAPIVALPAAADDRAGARSGPVTLGGGWQNWLDRWWVEPELEWDDDGEGVDVSIDAEIGHMVTERLGFWGRPAYRSDGEAHSEDWDLRFGIRYRFD